WHNGVHNYMIFLTGGIPVGAYDPGRLSNLGIGHGAVDGSFGYTYFDDKTGSEFSGLLRLTFNMTNPTTQYRSGIDLHLDWGASQALNKQLQIGIGGYLYRQITCDNSTPDIVGCFESRVLGIGPQVGIEAAPRTHF